MMQGLSGLFSTSSGYRKGSMQTGYVGRMVQQLENKIGSLIETSRIISLAKTRLELFRIAVDHEITTQQQLLQHEITSMQNQLRILVEPSAPEGETSISESMGALEGYIRNSIQSFQHLTQTLEERSTDRSVHEFAIRPFEETKLVRRLGKLQGMVQANQFVSLPRQSVDIMVMKLVRKIVLRELELQHEVLSLGAESTNLEERICGIQLEVSRKNFEISNEYIDRSVGFVRGEESSTADSTSANVKILKICATAQQELLMRLIQQMTAVAQENSVDADLFVTVRLSGTEWIRDFLNEISGFMFSEERPMSHTDPLQSTLLEFSKALLLEQHRLQEIVLSRSEDDRLQRRRIYDTISGIEQEISKAKDQYFSRLFLVAAISNREDSELKMNFLESEYDRLSETAGNSTFRAMCEVVKARLLDPAFFLECIRQSSQIVKQITQTCKELSRQEDDELNQLSRGILEDIRSFVASRREPKREEDMKLETLPLAGPLIPSGTPAITDQPESCGGSIPSQSSSSSGI